MNALLLAVDVPPISHVTIWGSGPLGFNKTAAIYVFATVATILLFAVGTRRKDALVPSGILQNSAESGVGFVRNQIIMQTMGTDGLRYLPYLTALFFFIFFSNITEIIPGVQFPANARFGMPLALALLTWVIFNVVGVVRQGPLHYLKNSLIPPGVPKAILPLVMIIELVSTFLVRPFSLMVRLFANMLAGHLILVTFGALCAALFAAKITVVILPFSFLLLVAMTGFEILVSFLQAFIFTILTAVYIDSSMHPSH
ncbi:MAG: synthase subunit [Actinomycetia bacterium]|jgi:F-type H+-transporting ATPase subunit a|nr:synthase subunit [Actinomycetes bacterium]